VPGTANAPPQSPTLKEEEVRRLSILALAAVLTVGVTATALGAFTQTASVKFTKTTTATSTGTTTALAASEPEAPAGKPSKAARKVVIKFPAGTVFNTAVPSVCRSNDDEIIATKGASCPRGSKVGAGSAEAITGFGAGVDPIQETIIAFNNKNELILYLTPKGTIGQTFVLRAKLKASSTGPLLTTVVPPLCLPGGSPPDCKNGEAVLTKFNLKTVGITKGSGAKKKNYVTTPPKCPKSKLWTTKISFTYNDGSKKDIKATQKCRA
jgi:hypothetical protein